MIDLIGRAGERFKLRVLAFCLMSNHYHLFVRTPDANLGAAMHWLNATCSIRHNLRRGLHGHVFQGRYKAVLVTRQAHWLNLSFYIHLNPVRAGLVDDPADYEWSSFMDYARARQRYDWLYRDEVLAAFGGSGPARRRRYRREALGLAGEGADFWEEFGMSLARDARREREKLAATHPPGGDPAYTPEFLHATRQDVDAEAELERLAAAFNIDPDELLEKRRSFPPRLAAYYYLTQKRGVKAKAVADLIGVTPGAVAQGSKKFGRIMRENKGLARKIKRLTDQLKT